MATIKVPPQAYTRETLAQAYSWLNDQPKSIKARAKNADALVSLYLHACRHGLDVFEEKEAVDAPRSIQDFKNTLKDLSKDIHQFEDKQQKATEPEVCLPADSQEFEPLPSAHSTYFYNEASALTESNNSPPSPQPPLQKPLSLDHRSLDTIRRVQIQMNLSSESEALRMLISLGYDRVRNILA